jgi:hypothetical protein
MPVYTYYAATVRARAWKQHTCCACGCVYRYATTRVVRDTGGLEVIARERAARKAAAELKKVVEVRPCPACGTVQPDMLFPGRLAGHALAAVLTLAVAGWLLAATLLGALPLDTAVPCAAGVAGVAALLHLLVARGGPNAHRQAGLRDAQAAVAAGTMELVQPGDGDVRPAPRPSAAWLVPGVALTAVAPLALLAPAHVQATRTLPENAGLRPALIAPGVAFTAPLPNPTFQSVDGKWAGTPKVELLNAAEVGGPPTLAASSQSPNWGERATVAQGASNWSPAELYVNVTVPDDPALAGRTLKLRATLDVVYPYRTGRSTFVQKATTVSREFAVTLAAKADYHAFHIGWVIAVAGGGFGTLFGVTVLATAWDRLRARARPAELVPEVEAEAVL